MINFFISINLTKQAIERGFNETCFGWVDEQTEDLHIGQMDFSNKGIEIPLSYQLKEWLFDRYKISVDVFHCANEDLLLIVSLHGYPITHKPSIPSVILFYENYGCKSEKIVYDIGFEKAFEYLNYIRK